MSKWLQEYVNRIFMNWTIFLFTGVLVILAALVAISLQAIKAAIANPGNHFEQSDKNRRRA